MQLFAEIFEFLQKNSSYHEIPIVQTLPDPKFVMNGKMFVSFSTNNYLGFAHNPTIQRAATGGLRFGFGNCESRLLGGDLQVYRDLEKAIASLKKKEAALLFATGYLTNLGVLSTLTRCGQILRAYGFSSSNKINSAFFSDQYNHVSIQEGMRMSGEEVHTYRHSNMQNLRALLSQSKAEFKVIVTDGVFSQDGDIAKLPEILSLAEEFDCLIYIDDAHATGLLGATGGGTSEYYNCYSSRIIQMGTLSKAFGGIGGFVAADANIIEMLRLTSSAYGFTSTIPPDQAYGLLAAIELSRKESKHRDRLWSNQKYFVEALSKYNLQAMSTESAILPILVGDEMRCNDIANRLKESGYYVDSVIFPAVSRCKARLRFMVNTGHTHEQIDGVLEQLSKLTYKQ